MASTFTNKRNLEKPGDGDANWGSAVNNNTDAVEEELTYSSSKLRNELQGGNTFSSRTMWEQLALSSAAGGTVADDEFSDGVFDGRYVYFMAIESETFIRYDTTGRYRDITSWEQIAVSSAQGATLAAGDDFRYAATTFDGRYVYCAPVATESFIRFDTTGEFTDITAWQQMGGNSAVGGSVTATFITIGATFDGRYVYFPAINSDTHVRFDTTGSFTDASNWQQVAIASAQGAAVLDLAYNQCSFDGNYVYYVPRDSDTFIRFRANTTAQRLPTEYSQMSN